MRPRYKKTYSIAQVDDDDDGVKAGTGTSTVLSGAGLQIHIPRGHSNKGGWWGWVSSSSSPWCCPSPCNALLSFRFLPCVCCWGPRLPLSIAFSSLVDDKNHFDQPF